MLTQNYVYTSRKQEHQALSLLNTTAIHTDAHIHTYSHAKNGIVPRSFLPLVHQNRCLLKSMSFDWASDLLCLHFIDFWANYNQNQTQSLFVCVCVYIFGVHFNSTKWCTSYMKHGREISGIEWHELGNEWMNQVNICISIVSVTADAFASSHIVCKCSIMKTINLHINHVRF